MTRSATRWTLIFLTISSASAVRAAEKTGIQWPQFRGHAAAGVADGFPLPSDWDLADGKNVRWKTAIPGLGHSCPAIWNDRIFVTTAVGEKGEASLKIGLYGDIQPVNEDFPHKYQLLCLDKSSGKILWTQTCHEGVPQIKRHTKASHANCTPATNGKYVVAFFGAEGLYCYDFDGKQLWKKDFGRIDSGFFAMPEAQWGFASSPVIHEDRVIVQVDVQKDSFIAAFALADGRELWRTARNDVPTWSTPTVVASHGRTQVVCNGYKEIAGYDVATGKQLWSMEGGGDIPTPTPVAAHGLIYIASAHGPAAPIFAIRDDASGDIEVPEPDASNKSIAWWNNRGMVYMQTLLVYGDVLYGCRDNGVLTAYDAKTGKVHYKERIGKGNAGFTASPVAGDGKVYFTSEEGEAFVIKAGSEFERISMNTLNEPFMSTPSISEGVVYYRTKGHLVAVGKK